MRVTMTFADSAPRSGLTIPLSITLSDIKLSAFIILVFSRQKGITLVFRNDPLESLKVSSTFDSIPFVRDYLQKEIEGQLRNLFMEDLPAIIHRLSLRLWVPEYRAKEEREAAEWQEKQAKETAVDPLASPPQDPVDSFGNPLNTLELSALTLEGTEAHSLFSQKNLLRLAALTNSHRTLSLFTPPIRDAVFRASAGPSERGEGPGSHPSATPVAPSLSRSHSYAGSLSTTYTFNDAGSSSSQSRPGLTSYGSAMSGLSLGAGRSKAHARKRKKRVVNLRKRMEDGEPESYSEGSSYTTETASAPSVIAAPEPVPEDREVDLITPERSPNKNVRFRPRNEDSDMDITPRPNVPQIQLDSSHALRDATSSSARQPKQPDFGPPIHTQREAEPMRLNLESRPRSARQLSQAPSFYAEKTAAAPATPSSYGPGNIMEQAWMAKMAGEIARKVEAEKRSGRSGNFWDRTDPEAENGPPPAYGA